MLEGYQFRQEVEMQKIAWQTANLMNLHLKKKVTVKQLLGQTQTSTRESREANFAKLKERLNKGAG